MRFYQKHKVFLHTPSWARVVLFSFLLLVAQLGFWGCAILSPQNKFDMDPTKRYRLDATVIARAKDLSTIEKFDGMGVLHSSPLEPGKNFDLKFKTKGKFSSIHVVTCARSEPAEPDDVEYRYQFIPNEIEMAGGCAMTVSGYDAEKGKHAFAYIDFDYLNKNLSLSGEATCNNNVSSGSLMSCQTLAGVFMRIKFKEPTVVLPQEKCVTTDENGEILKKEARLRTDYVFRVPQDTCVWLFQAEDGKRAQLTTLGYQDFPLRDF